MQQKRSNTATTDHILFSGTAVPLASLVVAIGLATLSVWTRQHLALILASWLVLIALVFVEVRLRLIAEQSNSDTGGPSASALPNYFGSIVVLWLVGSASLAIGYQSTDHLPTPLGRSVTAVVCIATIAVTLLLLAYVQRTSLSTNSLRNSLASWCRATVWVGLIVVSISLLGLESSPALHKSVFQSLIFATLAPTLEWLVKTLARGDGQVSLASSVGLINGTFGSFNPVRSLLDGLQRRFAIDLRSTWALLAARRAFGPIVFSLITLGWLTTATVTIGPNEVGIHERFGRSVSRSGLEPGIHLIAPWPIDRVYRVATTRTRSMTLGFSGPESGAPLLWTKRHAADEYQLLLGNGRDLITINALVHFAIGDPWAWYYGNQDSEQMLRIAAEQALLRNTANQSLNGVLAENSAELVRRIEIDLVELIDEYAIGVALVGVSVQGLHPPIRVAADYQAVVSAQHEQAIAMLDAGSYEIDAVQSGRSRAIETTTQAHAVQQRRLRLAHGESDAFRHLQSVYAEYPEAVALELKLQTVEQTLNQRALVVIDDRIERDGGVLWFEN